MLFSKWHYPPNLPIWGLRAVTNIKDSFISLLILSVLAWIPTTQFSVKDTEASPSSLAECNTFLICQRNTEEDGKRIISKPQFTLVCFCAITCIIWCSMLDMWSHNHVSLLQILQYIPKKTSEKGRRWKHKVANLKMIEKSMVNNQHKIAHSEWLTQDSSWWTTGE